VCSSRSITGLTVRFASALMWRELGAWDTGVGGGVGERAAVDHAGDVALADAF